jgi:hypothetical protein
MECRVWLFITLTFQGSGHDHLLSDSTVLRIPIIANLLLFLCPRSRWLHIEVLVDTLDVGIRFIYPNGRFVSGGAHARDDQA